MTERRSPRLSPRPLGAASTRRGVTALYPYFASVFACGGGGGAGRSELCVAASGAPVAAVAVRLSWTAEQRRRGPQHSEPDAAWRGARREGGRARVGGRRAGRRAGAGEGRRRGRRVSRGPGRPGDVDAWRDAAARCRGGAEAGQGDWGRREVLLHGHRHQGAQEGAGALGGCGGPGWGLEEGARASPGPGLQLVWDLRSEVSGTQDYGGGVRGVGWAAPGLSQAGKADPDLTFLCPLAQVLWDLFKTRQGQALNLRLTYPRWRASETGVGERWAKSADPSDQPQGMRVYGNSPLRWAGKSDSASLRAVTGLSNNCVWSWRQDGEKKNAWS